MFTIGIDNELKNILIVSIILMCLDGARYLLVTPMFSKGEEFGAEYRFWLAE